MSASRLALTELTKLRALAATLIPSTTEMPSPLELTGFDELLSSVVHACSWDRHAIAVAIGGIPLDLNWDSARTYQLERPEQFELVSRLVAAAYVMAPEVLRALRYPMDRRHPAAIDEFAREFESGVLTPVLESRPRFRDPRPAPA